MFEMRTNWIWSRGSLPSDCLLNLARRSSHQTGGREEAACQPLAPSDLRGTVQFSDVAL